MTKDTAWQIKSQAKHSIKRHTLATRTSGNKPTTHHVTAKGHTIETSSTHDSFSIPQLEFPQLAPIPLEQPLIVESNNLDDFELGDLGEGGSTSKRTQVQLVIYGIHG